jgi:phosphoglycolate phosphatase
LWLFFFSELNPGFSIGERFLRDNLHAVIFDFDYTLADSSEGVIECVNHALRGLRLPSADPRAIRATIGMSLPDVFARLAGSGNADKAREFIRLFTARADEVMADRTVLFPDVPASLRRLKAGPLALAIASTKFRYRIEQILRRENLLDCIDAVVGGEDVERHKPDPACLLRTMEKLGCPPADALFVGDTPIDAETAQRGGVAFAAVLSGVSDREDFAPCPVEHFAPNLRQMADWILAQSVFTVSNEP